MTEIVKGYKRPWCALCGQSAIALKYACTRCSVEISLCSVHLGNEELPERCTQCEMVVASVNALVGKDRT